MTLSQSYNVTFASPTSFHLTGSDKDAEFGVTDEEGSGHHGCRERARSEFLQRDRAECDLDAAHHKGKEPVVPVAAAVVRGAVSASRASEEAVHLPLEES